MLLGLLLGCGPDPACVAMCEAAESRYTTCLADAGLDWGAEVGYQSAADYANWCATWVWEMEQTGGDPACAARRRVFATGTCADYYESWTSP